MTARSTVWRKEKGNGQYRLIYTPCAEYRDQLVLCKAELQSIFDKVAESCADHAFVKERNCVTNAAVHLGKLYVITFDVADFFDSISRRSLVSLVSDDLLSLVLEEGAPRQGLLTSPLVANIAMLDVDQRIQRLCETLGEISYSRYADDLTIGFNEVGLRELLHQGVAAILKSHGLTLNARKTRFQNSQNGLVHITGVAIDGHSVRPTRETLRRIRAATHRKNERQIRGLTEWAKCQLPRVKRTSRISELNATHPINMIALECLSGYRAETKSELAAITLIKAYWDEPAAKAHILARIGSIDRSSVPSTLRLLSRSDAYAVMKCIEQHDVECRLDIARLRQLDGVDIAADILTVILRAVEMGVRLPSAWNEGFVARQTANFLHPQT